MTKLFHLLAKDSVFISNYSNFPGRATKGNAITDVGINLIIGFNIIRLNVGTIYSGGWDRYQCGRRLKTETGTRLPLCGQPVTVSLFPNLFSIWTNHRNEMEESAHKKIDKQEYGTCRWT